MVLLKIYKRPAKGVGRLLCYARRSHAVVLPGYEQAEHCQIYFESLQGRGGAQAQLAGSRCFAMALTAAVFRQLQCINIDY